jgi:hypothetical protein
MFINGQKVIVINSTVKKGNIGPRKGSIGYVSDCKKNYFYNGMIITPVDIIFNRYGFEKRERIERRLVYVVLPPILWNDVKNFSPTKAIRSTLHTIPDGIEKIRLYIKEELFGQNNPIICTMGPLNGSCITESKNDVTAWTLSMLSCKRVSDAIYNWHAKKSDPIGKGHINVDFIQSLRVLMLTKDFSAFGKIINKNADYVINSIRMLTAHLPNDSAKINEQNVELFGPFDDRITVWQQFVYECMSSTFFNKPMYTETTSILLNISSVKNHDQVGLINRVESVRNSVKIIAHKLNR